MTDATCYESHLRCPSDMKLLWESIDYLYRHLSKECSILKISRPRSKYDDVRRQWSSYNKKRKRKQSKTRMLKRRMLYLLKKLLGEIDVLKCKYGKELTLSAGFQKRLCVIPDVLLQQQELFEGRNVSNRIVSCHKHYIRPIVWGS